MRKSLSEYALLAEIVSAAAVVITLIFVGIQVRIAAGETALNTSVMRASTYQDLAFGVGDNSDIQINNPEFAKLLVRMSRGESYKDETEEYIYITFLYAIFRKASIAFTAYESGILTEEQLASLLSLPRLHSTTQVGQPIWEGYQAFVSPDFVAFMNSLPNICRLAEDWVCVDVD